MKTVAQNIFFLIVGLFFGLKFSEIYISVPRYFPQGKPLNTSLTSSSTTTTSYDENSTNILPIAELLRNETRILCWVMTTPEYHKTRAIHVKNTWGARCDKLLFVSTMPDDELETLPLNVEEGHDHLWPKTSEAFKFIYDNYFDEADWFLKADDDTYIVMENLRDFLYPMSTEAPVYFGYRYQRRPAVHQGYMAGAAYVLSKEALYLFATQAYRNDISCPYEYKAEDLQLGMCLENVGVVAGDTRDAYSRNRFMPLSYNNFKSNVVSNWYWKYQYYPQNMTDCCSDSAIAFHYVKGYDMHFMEYLLYHVSPRRVQDMTTLPPKLDMEFMLQKWRLDEPVDTENIKL